MLDDKECQQLIDALDRLQDTEEKLFHFVNVRIEHEKMMKDRRELAEKQE